MTDSTLTFRVDEQLKSAFAEVAKGQDRNAAQLLRDFMRATVEQSHDRAPYDAWFRGQVALGLDAAAKGQVYSDEETERHFAELHEKALARQMSAATGRQKKAR
ncbi:MAG TPA: hypothetical protein VGC74_12655 [Stenotrophomonas sp.]|jgi:predicted transcriptional regulator